MLSPSVIFSLIWFCVYRKRNVFRPEQRTVFCGYSMLLFVLCRFHICCFVRYLSLIQICSDLDRIWIRFTNVSVLRAISFIFVYIFVQMIYFYMKYNVQWANFFRYFLSSARTRHVIHSKLIVTVRKTQYKNWTHPL